MAVKRPKSRLQTKPLSEAEIDRVIDNGGGVPRQAESLAVKRDDIKFQMVIPADICDLIDRDRAPSKTSRRAWLLQRAMEYLDAKNN